MPQDDDEVQQEDREDFDEEQKGDDVEGAENKADREEPHKEERSSNQH
jgi:hypothetical protein